MSRQDAAYMTKHPSNATADPAIAADIHRLAEAGKLTCAQAHRIAEQREVSPSEVGKALDLLNIRITACQLGLFAKRDAPSDAQAADLPPHLLASLESESALTCRDAWELAARHNVSYAVIGAACNARQIKIVTCQLGAF